MPSPSLIGQPARVWVAAGLLIVLLVAAFRAAGDLPAPLSSHMGRHIVLMNAAAPLTAWLSTRIWPAVPSGWRLTAVTGLQLAVLLLWHAPALMEGAQAHAAVAVLMWCTLFAVAFGFWRACFAMPARSLWMPIAAVAVTGKLFCLFAALFVLAPRVLYADLGTVAALCGGARALEDQHLAGLLMLTACPLSYVAAGIYFAQGWIVSLERNARRGRA